VISSEASFPTLVDEAIGPFVAVPLHIVFHPRDLQISQLLHWHLFLWSMSAILLYYS
jgi:hypothetical protein